jgi:hypothetical protein
MRHTIRSMTVARYGILLLLLALAPAVEAADATQPIVAADVVFAEIDGTLAIEAEHFYKQTQSGVRAWHITSSRSQPQVTPDADPAHLLGAVGGAYVEVLPDTRQSDRDRLIAGENFSNDPGKLAVLHYKAHFSTPGRYYVWARTYSTGAEDNGVHFGLDGTWPASGQRWQTVAKRDWHWDCKQRTQQVHTGVPLELYLDIERAGQHEIMVSMREDGFELDRFVLTTKRENGKPEGIGPPARVKSGTLPPAFPEAPAAAATTPAAAAQDQETPQPRTSFPSHWGQPPQVQTRDYVPLPGGFGNGSSTLRNWIQQNLDKDNAPQIQPRQPDGKNTVEISGDLKQWHKVTLTLDGPYAHERDNDPNPYTDVALMVTFTHESGSPRYVVPGYFAADGNAGNTGAMTGTKWRAHLSPDKPGRWNYAVSLRKEKDVAFAAAAATSNATPLTTGSFTIAPTDKTGRDFRAHGRLQYVGKHHLQFAGSGEYFLKAGPDSPETLLGYADFDDTVALKKNVPLKTYEPHLRDWRAGDPTWKGDKGKGLIGALNYVASKGCNNISFLPYNAGGDGDNVWPFVSRDDKFHYDCSKLDQWQIVFDHATVLGMHLHFKLQEQENDDNRTGHEAQDGKVQVSLDGGKLGRERKLYCRELVARFAHELALNWNLGEENTQSATEQRDMIRYLHQIDPYHHNIVVHTFPDWQDKVYPELLGDKSLLTGASLQNSWSAAHQRTLKWVQESAAAGKPWVVANDEHGPASLGVPPDPGYKGHDGVAKVRSDGKAKAKQGSKSNAKVPSPEEIRGYTLHDIRKFSLWGNLLAGGAGVEYYFGYQLPENDLVGEDFRSRDKSWDYCRIALEFFRDQKIPFEKMACADALVGNPAGDNSRYCLALLGEVYVVYLPAGGTADLDLKDSKARTLAVKWFDPRNGGSLLEGSVKTVSGPATASLGLPPREPDQDWVLLVR